MTDIKLSTQRQEHFAKVWFSFLRLCRSQNVKMNQSIAAQGMKIKRSTFSHAVNYGPSDMIILRFSRFTGIPSEQIDKSLENVKPLMLSKQCDDDHFLLKKAS